MSDMKIIIPMAGEGKRFKKMGITEPKYMIKVRNKTLFEWSMLSLKNFYKYEFIFIARKERGASKFIRDKCGSLGIRKHKIKEIDYLTAGQAATVLAANNLVKDERPIIIYNIDTYVEPNRLEPKDIKGDGWIPAFEAQGTHWSFVKFDKSKRVEKITEKIRISKFATIGLYYFSSYKLFKECYMNYNFNQVQRKEHYIAPLYSLLINSKTRSVYAHLIRPTSVHVLGTPKEVKLFDVKFKTKIK